MNTSVVDKYFPKLSAEQQSKISQLGTLYQYWNERINVISRKDVENIYVRHVLHSLSIAKFTSFSAHTRIIDIGTGGGFPGIPLAILFPEVQFHLIDSIGKKIKVVKEIAHELKLKNVLASQVRAENEKAKYDFIVSRAVTHFDRFVHFSKHLLQNGNNSSTSNGIIYLKGGDFEEEIARFKNLILTINLRDYFEDDFFETKKIIYLPYAKKINNLY